MNNDRTWNLAACQRVAGQRLVHRAGTQWVGRTVFHSGELDKSGPFPILVSFFKGHTMLCSIITQPQPDRHMPVRGYAFNQRVAGGIKGRNFFTFSSRAPIPLSHTELQTTDARHASQILGTCWLLGITSN